MTPESPHLAYVYDALCGWCYGFSPVIQKLAATYADQLPVSVYSGGLAIGPRALPIKEAFGYIKGALPTLEKATGVKFGDAFVRNILESGEYVYNSEPAGRALTALKAQLPEKALDYAHRLQNAFFRDGRDFNDLNTFVALVKDYPFDEAAFRQTLEGEEGRYATYQEFKQVQEWGITGFPAVVLFAGNRGWLLSRGYLPYEPLRENLEKALTEI